MCNYTVLMIAYPTGSDLERTIKEILMSYNYEKPNSTYYCEITDIKTDNIVKGLENCIQNGFKEENTNV